MIGIQIHHCVFTPNHGPICLFINQQNQNPCLGGYKEKLSVYELYGNH